MFKWNHLELINALSIKKNDATKIKVKPKKITGFSIDTRTLSKGNIFICIKGANYDAHNFIKNAYEKKPAAFIVSKKFILPKDLTYISNEIPFYPVNDTEHALRDLASYYRNKISATIIAITGSNGKTSTKEIIYSMLVKIIGKDKVFASLGNFNNHLGLPLSLLKVNQKHKFVILEMGMSNKGEITNLCKIARPHHAIITRISNAHSQNFKTINDIAKAKLELANSLPKNAILLYNASCAGVELAINIAKKKNLNLQFFCDKDELDLNKKSGGVGGRNSEYVGTPTLSIVCDDDSSGSVGGSNSEYVGTPTLSIVGDNNSSGSVGSDDDKSGGVGGSNSKNVGTPTLSIVCDDDSSGSVGGSNSDYVGTPTLDDSDNVGTPTLDDSDNVGTPTFFKNFKINFYDSVKLSDKGISFKWNNKTIISKNLFHKGNASNLFASILLFKLLGINLQKLIKASSSVKLLSKKRFDVIYKKRTKNLPKQLLIDDTYNANLTSYIEGLKGFRAMLPLNKKLALILGEMKELGKDSLESHKKVLDIAIHLGYDIIAIVTENLNKDLEKYYLSLNNKLIKNNKAVSYNKNSITCKYYTSSQDFINKFFLINQNTPIKENERQELQRNLFGLEEYDGIFVKGSRYMKMEIISDFIKNLDYTKIKKI